jgi:hypothetical protein
MWRAWGRTEVCTGCWWGSRRERRHWGDQDVDGWIILRWIFRKMGGFVGTGCSWLRIGTDGGLLWVRWGTFWFHKCGEFWHLYVLGGFIFRVALVTVPSSWRHAGMCGSAGCGGVGNQWTKAIRCSACYYSIVLQVWPIPTSTPLESKKRQNTINKSKRIPSIFNDESTESFICLSRHIYMSHVNKVQDIYMFRYFHH